jgi:hypothetical protein
MIIEVHLQSNENATHIDDNNLIKQNQIVVSTLLCSTVENKNFQAKLAKLNRILPYLADIIKNQ